MRINTTPITDSFTIYEAPRANRRGELDPIHVILRDCGGSGQIIVTCFSSSWTQWFGAIGQQSLRDFIAQCDHGYLADKLLCNTSQKFNYVTTNWVHQIARAVIDSMKVQAA